MRILSIPLLTLVLACVASGPLAAQNRSELRSWSRALDKKVMRQDAFEFEFRRQEREEKSKSLIHGKGTMRWWRCGRLVKKSHDAEVRVTREKELGRARVRVISDGKYLWRVSDLDGVQTCEKDVAPRRAVQGELYTMLARYKVSAEDGDRVAGRDCLVYAGHETHGKKLLRVRVWMDAKTGFLLRREDFDDRGKSRASFRVTAMRPLADPKPADFRFVPPRRTEVVDLTAPRPATEAELAKKGSTKSSAPKVAKASAKKAPLRKPTRKTAAAPKAPKTKNVNGIQGMKRFARDANSGSGGGGGARPTGGLGIR